MAPLFKELFFAKKTERLINNILLHSKTNPNKTKRHGKLRVF